MGRMATRGKPNVVSVSARFKPGVNTRGSAEHLDHSIVQGCRVLMPTLTVSLRGDRIMLMLNIPLLC